MENDSSSQTTVNVIKLSHQLHTPEYFCNARKPCVNLTCLPAPQTAQARGIGIQKNPSLKWLSGWLLSFVCVATESRNETRRNNKGERNESKEEIQKFVLTLPQLLFHLFSLTWSNSSSYYPCETLPQLNVFLFSLLKGDVKGIWEHITFREKTAAYYSPPPSSPLREKVNLNKAAAATNRTVTSAQRNRQWECFSMMSYLYLLLIICWVVTMCSLNLTFYWWRALSFWVLLETFRPCSFFPSPGFFQLLYFYCWRIQNILKCCPESKWKPFIIYAWFPRPLILDPFAVQKQHKKDWFLLKKIKNNLWTKLLSKCS